MYLRAGSICIHNYYDLHIVIDIYMFGRGNCGRLPTISPPKANLQRPHAASPVALT